MKIIAMVRFNDNWAYVFDEPISLKYREEVHDGTRYLIGQSGPFFDFLKYEKSAGRFKAFAGRPLTLHMVDGTTQIVKNDWWSCGNPLGETQHITYSTVAELKRCYVYSGGECHAAALQEMTEEYDNRTSKPYGHRAGGYRYDYYDYEKIINFDDLRTSLFATKRRMERGKRHLIKNVKVWAALAKSREVKS